MRSADIQQLIDGFKTVEVISGPLTVRVHEALDSIYVGNRHRYFISVDLKFRQSDALNIGNPGWYGVTKGEATRSARELAIQIAVSVEALRFAEELPDTPTNRITKRRQLENYNQIIGRYDSEMEPLSTGN